MTAPEIQQEIERTRDHLGETVEELAARADVKARARARAAGMKDKAARMKVRAQACQHQPEQQRPVQASGDDHLLARGADGERQRLVTVRGAGHGEPAPVRPPQPRGP